LTIYYWHIEQEYLNKNTVGPLAETIRSHDIIKEQNNAPEKQRKNNRGLSPKTGRELQNGFYR